MKHPSEQIKAEMFKQALGIGIWLDRDKMSSRKFKEAVELYFKMVEIYEQTASDQIQGPWEPNGAR
jgi:hypothetical protein